MIRHLLINGADATIKDKKGRDVIAYLKIKVLDEELEALVKLLLYLLVERVQNWFRFVTIFGPPLADGDDRVRFFLLRGVRNDRCD